MTTILQYVHNKTQNHRRTRRLALILGLACMCLPGTSFGQDQVSRPHPMNPPALPSAPPAHPGGFASGAIVPDTGAGFPLPNATTWTAIGPAPLNSGGTYSGRLAGVAADPVDGSIYIAAAGGGVWKSTNGGTSYTPLTDNQGTLAMGAIAIAPSNHLRIYAGTGEANNAQDSNFGGGVLVSTDGGSSWTLSTGGGAFYRKAIGKISVNPTNELNAYAAVNDFAENGVCCSGTGIFETTDGGTTWTNVTLAAGLDGTYPWSDVVVDPNTPTTIYAAYGAYFGYSANGVYRSTNGGASWALLSGAGSGVSLGRIALAVAPSATTAGQHVLYVAVISPSTYGLFEMLRSNNADAASPSFTNLSATPNFTGSQGWYNVVIGVDPSNANNVYAAGSVSTTIIQSTNGGTSWTNITTVGGIAPHTDCHAMAFDASNRMLLGTDGGIWRFDPTVPSWTNLNANINTIQFTGIGLHPTSPQTVVGGSQDNGTELTTGNIQWNATDGGDGGYSQISQTDGVTCYSNHPIASFGTANFFRVSTNGCTSFTSRTPSVTSTNFNFYAPIFVDPSNGSRVFLGGYALFESTNAGNAWVSHTSPSSNAIDAIAVVPGGTTIYLSTGGAFATSSQIWASTNDGTSWTQVSLGVGGRVNELDIDPNDNTGQTLIAVVNTFNSPNGQVYRTTNGGTSWSNINGNLPALPAWSAKIGSDTNRTIYVSNEIGVYSSPAPYSTWTTLGSGLPHAQGVHLELNASLHELAVATHGRGAWYLSVQAAQTITFGPLSNQVIGTPPFTISATASSGLPVAFTSTTTTICTVSGSTVTLVKTGLCSITASQNGNSSYSPATPVTQTFRITAGTTPQTITFAALPNKTFGMPPFTVSATASSGLPVHFASTTATTCTVSGNTVTLVAPGRCAIQATQPGSATYAPATPKTQAFQIAKEPQTITFAALPGKTIGAPPFTVSATASSGLAVTFASMTTATCTVSGNTVTLVAGGRCAIQATQAGNADFAAATPVTRAFQIAKLAQTISFAALPAQTLGNPPFTVSATASSGLAVSFASTTSTTCSVSGNTVTLIASGRCAIKATQAGNGTYAAATPVTQGFQIKP